jgi:hypothetical protein
MHICPICILHGGNLITSKEYKLGILDDNFNGLFHFIVYMFYYFPTNLIRPMFFWNKSKSQELKQRLEIFIICQWFIFTWKVENNDKLNKFLFHFHCLTKIKLLNDNFWK